MKEHQKSHKKHGHHPHDHVAAMPQFNEGHWQKNVADVMCADENYSSGEMNQMEDYKKSVDSLAEYARKHKAKH